MKNVACFLIIFSVFISTEIFPQKPSGNNYYSPTSTSSWSHLNLNNISSVFRNNGISDINISQDASGFNFPKETGKTAVYQSGLLWGAFLNRPSEMDPHVGGSMYRSGLQPGKILSPGVAEDPEAEHVRIYRVRPDVYPGGPPVDLSWEAFDEGKTQLEVRTQYETDWVEWRANDGAPYDDVDTNGSYNPNIDVPGITGASQTIWFVANDLDPALTTFLYGTDPMGIEYQATYWEYKDGSFLDNLFFRKYKLINKSDVAFDSMYISMWSDIDIGDAGDDFAGCDTTLNLGYALNGFEYDAVYDSYPPPAVGFDLLQGPLVPGDSTLPMTAYFAFICGDPFLCYPVQGSYSEGAVRFYRLMQGRNGSTNEPFINPVTGLPTSYIFSGDPLTSEGWIDGMDFYPGDRSIGLASGPFNMAVGDTQEVVIAEIAAMGFDRLDSYKKLKFYSSMVQNTYDAGYYQDPVPKPLIPLVTVEKTGPQVELNWGEDQQSVDQIESFDQSGYKFQGYNIYQLNSTFSSKENSVRIATFDIEDGITEIPGLIMDPETGLAIEGVVQNGSDSGIERTISIDTDYLDNSHMIVGKKYYFAVTAYTYNPDPAAFTNNSESLLDIIEVIYCDDLEGANYGDSLQVLHSQGIGDGEIIIKVTDPTKLTGEDYEVYFRVQKYYRNEEGEWIPISEGDKSSFFDPDTLIGSSIDIGAVYGPASGVIELSCYLNLVASDGNWVDGITMTFPSEVTIVDFPEFWAGGGLVSPEVIGNVVNMGIVDGSQTQNGIFNGGEEWTMFISSFDTPMTVEWIMYDDGYSGGALNAEGTTTIEEMGYEFKTQHEWNLRNLTRLDTLLEAQTVINGYDLYTYEYVGDPIVEGFQISVNVKYDGPYTYGLIRLNGESLSTINEPGSPGTEWTNEFWEITDYTIFGSQTGTSFDKNGYGTQNPDILEQDYEFKWTGVEELVHIGGRLIYVTKEGSGSIATLYGASYYDIADHPLNPNSGSDDPFLVRIPFEVWNKTTGEQVNYQIYDRTQDFPSDSFKVWNTENRVYGEILNTPYDSTHIANGEMGGSDTSYYTWMNVWWLSQWTTGDVIETYYYGPITPEDKFTFTTPEPVDTTYKFIPGSYQLFHNYPNPFNPITTIRFEIPIRGMVKLDVYDILGQRVKQLLNTELTEGRYEIEFNGSNLASGVYIYVLNIRDKFFEAKKMVLLK